MYSFASKTRGSFSRLVGLDVTFSKKKKQYSRVLNFRSLLVRGSRTNQQIVKHIYTSKYRNTYRLLASRGLQLQKIMRIYQNAYFWFENTRQSLFRKNKKNLGIPMRNVGTEFQVSCFSLGHGVADKPSN